MATFDWTETATRPRIWVPVVATVVIGGSLLAVWQGLPVQAWAQDLCDAVQALGFVGAVLFALAYALAVIVFAPATPFTVAAGSVYGLAGIPIALAGALLGAVISFALARRGLRDRIACLCRTRMLTLAIDRTISRLGWRGVLMVRLSPGLPFSLQNYLFGASAVTAPAYVMATVVGMVPATLIKVMLGALGTDAGRFGWISWALLALGLAASVIATWMFARTLRAERVLIEAEGGANAARVRAGCPPLREAA